MTRHRGFAIVDLLALVLVAGALLAVLLTSLAHAGGASGAITSADNLRTLGAAHAAYAADWDGRQLTFVDDLIGSYGDNVGQAFNAYNSGDRVHPGVELGWGQLREDDDFYTFLAYRTGSSCANAALTLPIVFSGAGCNPSLAGLGSFRLFNAMQFSQYLGGRFYDEVFYAPKDEVVLESIDAGGCFDSRDGYCRFADVSDALGDIPAWSSYCMSPAAMFDPAVFAHDDPDDDDFNGWVNPWSLDDGFTSPALSQALYPDLKTFVLEHHWLQNNPGEECNPNFDPGTYGGCEPYYFNHAFASSPVTLFYDGHIAEVSISQAIADDAFVRDETGNDNWGLWSEDTAFGEDGYFGQYAWDTAQTSMHVLTTDGIRGRDVLNAGVRAPARSAFPRPREARAPQRIDTTLRSTRITISGE